MPDLLIELFSEEIPARMQARAAEDLNRLMTDGLVEAGLTYASAGAFHTPRRLTLSVEGLLDRSPDVKEERKGPRVDAPEKAVEGFLRGAGVTRDQLEERDDKKGKVFFAIIERPGRPVADIVAEVLEKTIRNFPWPKSMRWGARSLRWVRPLHSILCILTREDGSEIVPLDIDGIKASNETHGHRFMAPGIFAARSFEDYEAQLRTANVVLRADERAEHIWHDATNMAFAQGLEVVEDKGLLSEVAGLVEWPVVLMGDIGEEFMELPPEVLQTSMKEHQKFFSVRNPKTGRIEKFITVANRETADQGATILAGNQKVLSARLSDAKFFWENDLRIAKHGADVWLDSLKHVTFHNRLGSQGQRVLRISKLAKAIAPLVGAGPLAAEEAGRFAKADLSSEMVYEFPELQGIMGQYYARHAGYSEEIAEAATEHYSPLGPSDDVPSAPVSISVALADKLDTLTGFWVIDEKPTGSKDPFALRRAALGVIRLILENDIRAELQPLLATAMMPHVFEQDLREGNDPLEARKVYAQFMGIDEAELAGIELENVADLIAERGLLGGLLETLFHKNGNAYPDEARIADLMGFFHDRLKVYLRDQGIRHDVIDACLSMPLNDDLMLLVKRARALQDFLGTDDGENLLQGFKRANNILTQAEDKDGVEYSYGADVKFAEDDSEKALFAALDTNAGAISSAVEAEDFAAAMGGMAALRQPIDTFFDTVQVNTENEILRRNRLNLLSRIREICLSVADLRRVEG